MGHTSSTPGYLGSRGAPRLLTCANIRGHTKAAAVLTSRDAWDNAAGDRVPKATCILELGGSVTPKRGRSCTVS
jgi:hypothetical protein